jgi:hypothetical protein
LQSQLNRLPPSGRFYPGPAFVVLHGRLEMMCALMLGSEGPV